MKTFLSTTALAMFSIMLIFCIGCFYSYFYPIKYKEQISAVSSQTEVNPALIASIINVESNYDKEARSNKGAVGLMQIMPETAEWVCKYYGLEKNPDLENEENNILLGTLYLKYLLSTFSDQDVAICAYNAGPNRVRSWLAQSENGKLTEIPYKETRNYLENVKKNLRYYQKKY